MLATGQPSSTPIVSPMELPTSAPSSPPSKFPRGMPSSLPSSTPSGLPSLKPSEVPSELPTMSNFHHPTTALQASNKPTIYPTSWPTGEQTETPIPSQQPSANDNQSLFLQNVLNAIGNMNCDMLHCVF